MNTMTIEEAQAKLPEIIDKLDPGEEVLITRSDKPDAKQPQVPRTKEHCCTLHGGDAALRR
jgi:antitoxin (DNA-binding transcriptional repressor) of toxin-antitoxin stability system